MDAARPPADRLTSSSSSSDSSSGEDHQLGGLRSTAYHDPQGHRPAASVKWRPVSRSYKLSPINTKVVREFADSEGHLKVVRESVFDYRDSYGAHGYPDVDLGGADQAHGEHRHPAWLPDRPPWPDCRPPTNDRHRREAANCGWQPGRVVGFVAVVFRHRRRPRHSLGREVYATTLFQGN